jgi:hypothetical protein
MERFAMKPDGQLFDEISITTVPRFKTSGLSGDQWRISAKIEMKRKGKTLVEEHYRDVETALKFVQYLWCKAADEALGYYCGGEDGKCDQEGCSEEATVKYRVKKEYCNRPYTCQPKEHDKEVVLRQFCGRHAQRGDCAFDDADDNYVLIEGEAKPEKRDNSPSAFGGVVSL